MGGVTFDQSNSDPTLFHTEKHGYFDISSSSENLDYLTGFMSDIAKLGGTNEEDFDKDWFFEKAEFMLDIAGSPSQNFDFARRKYPARLEVKNPSYTPIDFGQFVAGMRSGILVTTANMLGRGTDLENFARIRSTHKTWNSNKKPRYRFILADGDHEVDRYEIEKLVTALKPLEVVGDISNKRKRSKTWTICTLGDYVWFSRDLIQFIRNTYLTSAANFAHNEWAKFLLIEHISDGKISYLPLKDHGDKKFDKMLQRMEKNIKTTLDDYFQSKTKQSIRKGRD